MSAASTIRAVTFDVGQTLIEPLLSVGEVYAAAAAEHGCPNLPAGELGKRFRAVLQARGSAVNTRADWARIVDDTFAGLLPKRPSETFFPELFERFAQPSAWRIFDDVWPALDELTRRGLRLGVISNWDERLRPLLAALGLGARFEVVMISCEVGHAKPAREIFESAAKLFQLPPAEIFHVGDNFEADVRGARAAGFRAVQIARASAPSADSVASLLELPRLIRSGVQ